MISVLFLGKKEGFLGKYLPKDVYDQILMTYADQEVQNNWRALFKMTEIFTAISITVAGKLNFDIDASEAENARRWLKQQYDRMNS